MSTRPFSRPRTRIYDVNYNIGETYYKPAIDRLDRKYSGRPLSPSPRQTSVPKDLLERHERAFEDEDLSTSRARAKKHISESNMFDSRSGIIASKAMDAFENDIDEETASKLQRIRANKKVSVVDDVDLNSTMNNIKARTIRDRADRMLDTVGITTVEAPRHVEDVTYKRRSLKISMESSNEGSDLTKWSKLGSEEDSAASIRARQSKARINELEDEMNAMAEKSQARERRSARLRAVLAENAEQNDIVASQMSRMTTRQKREAVEF